MTFKTPKVLLTSAVASCLLLSTFPAYAHEFENTNATDPVALVLDSPSEQKYAPTQGIPEQLSQRGGAPSLEQLVAHWTAPQANPSPSELKSLGLPLVQNNIARYRHTAGNFVSMAATDASADGDFSFAYWGELSEETEAILFQIEQLWPQDSYDWDEQQWEEFEQTETGQQILALFEELNALILMELPEESRLLIEAMEALLPQESENWDEDAWEAYYQTEDGQQFLQLLEQYFASFFDDEDYEVSEEEEAFWELLESLLPEGFEDWEDEAWEEFYETENGQEYLRLLDEYYGFEYDEEEEAFWELLESLLPEGFEDWEDEAWEEFYETENGQEFLRLLNEYYGFEYDEEEEAFWESLNQMLPEGSDDWEESEWDAYYQTDDGKKLLEFVLTYELDNVEDEQELELLLEYYREVLQNQAEWLEQFLLEYFDTSETPTPQESQTPQDPAPTKPAPTTPEPETVVEPTQESKQPSEVVPVNDTDPSPAPEATKAPSGPLAATGSQGLFAAGLGIVLVALGALSLRLRLKAKHKA